MNYSYIIVEDRQGCIDNLSMALRDFPNYIASGFATSLSQGIALALKTKPNIIFLDVELGAESGFELIAELRPHFHKMPSIIMTTDHDKYAKKAVNNDVLYFLDKPIDPDELTRALAKFEKRYADLYPALSIKDSEGHWNLPYTDIFYIQANGSTIDLYTTSLKKINFSRTLKEIEQALPTNFLRIHNSYIVNIQSIERWNTTAMKVYLRAKTGLIESFTDSNLHIEDKLQYKETTKELPIGDKYLDLVKNTLGVSKTQ